MTPPYDKYKHVMAIDPDSLQKRVNELAAQGYELTSAYAASELHCVWMVYTAEEEGA